MQDQKTIEYLAYGWWLAITKEGVDPATVFVGSAVLGTLLFILGYQSSEDILVYSCIDTAKKALEAESIQDPMGVVVIDLAKRKDAVLRALKAAITGNEEN